MKMSVDFALQKIHREYEGDSDYLSFEDEETTLRVEYLKDSIKEWYDKFPQKREQFLSLVDMPDGTKLTSAGVTTYDCPSRFIRPSGFVKLGDSIYLSYIDPTQMDLKLKDSPNEEWYTVLGSPGAYKIKINPAPGSVMPINYDFHGEPSLPATTTDLIPCSRPLFCVYYSLWKIYKEDDSEQEQKYKDLMDEEVRHETVALAMTPGRPNTLKVGGAGFGDTGSSVANILTGN